MEKQTDSLKKGLLQLKSHESIYKEHFKKYEKIQDFSVENVKSIIQKLADTLFKPQCTITICQAFSQIFLEILYQAIPLDKSKDEFQKTENYMNHVKNCITLGKLLEIHPDALRFSLQYFNKYPAPFDQEYFNDQTACEVPAKKRRQETFEFTDFDIVHCCYQFLMCCPVFVREKWNWSIFVNKFLYVEESFTKWLALQCIAIVTGMSIQVRDMFLREHLPHSNLDDFIIQYEEYCTNNIHNNENHHQTSSIPCETNFLNSISKHVVSIANILIPIFNNEKIQSSNIVEVESTKRNLKKIALAIAANKAICLNGPVGSGKTALVEHIVARTGRVIGESFIKVQLGDQTDSKMLLGTYRCTDVPGEFVWQPGVITQAVMEGHWLLLEDINSASSDVATVITSLLENNSLSVPGYRDSIPVAPGFLLFLTQRSVTTFSGHQKHSTHSSVCIEKNVFNINIETLSENELIEIVKTSYPQLSTIATRIVDVYLLFSSGMHARNSTTSRKHLEDLIFEHQSRLISTRDLIKFCARAIVDFNIAAQESALKVFQDAIDIFCCSLNKLSNRVRQACEIAARLGIIHTKAEYFCKEYKPSINFHGNFNSDSVTVGRVSLPCTEASEDPRSFNVSIKFSFTRPSVCLLERIACCIKNNEPVLLVGETGVGKTASIQYLANVLKQKLIVINMNQQSDSADLLGGYKPVDLKYVVAPVRNQFEQMFRNHFNTNANAKFLQHISYCFNSNKYLTLTKLMLHSQKAAVTNLKKESHTCQQTLDAWLELGVKLNKLLVQLQLQNSIAFAFIEGSLVKALEKGYWVLLDEINLATAETLECLSGLLEGASGSLSLFERGDKKMLQRHPNFTLFACMNPATDVGKKDLPAGLRNRFTEFFVDELTEKSDLLLLVHTYLKDLSVSQKIIESIVKFYMKIRQQAENVLTDGTGHKPHFSLRTLCRALMVAARNPCGNVLRSLYEAFCLSFLTQLNAESHLLVESLISKAILGDEVAKKSVLSQSIPEPSASKDQKFIPFEGYWISQGILEPAIPDDYILTKSVRRNLRDLVRIVSIARIPILLQGDTSVGKTSLITYLAKASGNKCLRINNHEHTDLQEYIGSYVADVSGKLVFREGILVEAMRKGYWIILDELNLAPSDVLEALNRVLDDNRELFIAETQETVKAHPNFMLFATQNPPGLYGGRKVLSRAFRNRFVELHFDEIPSLELEIILEQRCQIPASYCKKMIQIMSDLQIRRRKSAAFAGKKGFITLRDLFRWGERYRLATIDQKGFYDWDQHIADEGYLLLAGKVRDENERTQIMAVIKNRMKRDITEEKLFTLNDQTSLVTKQILENLQQNTDKFPNIVWTFNARKLAVMVSKALQFKEPVLLVGGTGGGKTTICQVLAAINSQTLYTVNCHLHTESSDFLGGLRPVRDHTQDNDRLFEWVDGPLIKAMQQGGLFLVDEISLADDSVLERLNSVLEPERTLLLAEKGIADLITENIIIANEKFNFVSTMNPGGDFGKKELSPALRNRFTEIWCDSVNAREDLVTIINHNIAKNVTFGNRKQESFGEVMMDFVEYFKSTDVGSRITTSIRDILTWVQFINVCSSRNISVAEAYYHGAKLVFLDNFGSGTTSNESEVHLAKIRNLCLDFINRQLNSSFLTSVDESNLANVMCHVRGDTFGIRPFYIERGPNVIANYDFTFSAPSTSQNTLRLLRAMQLNKAILIEGSPGVGKTSLVNALAKASGHTLLRINLSDQTDISDLFGNDLPVEGGRGGEFCWRDGPFLRALKNGDWILLDELNLASQSVLEGLNACLDHRGEIFIPELAKTFHIKQGTRLFGCQNPLKQGGSRKGLPQSFLNRFIQVYISPLTCEDLRHIAFQQYPTIPQNFIEFMVEFNEQIVKEVLINHTFGAKGGPWEFNLRDIQRWCDGLLKLQEDQIEFCDDNGWTCSELTNKDRNRADLIIQDLTKKRLKDKESRSREVRRLLMACPDEDQTERFEEDLEHEDSNTSTKLSLLRTKHLEERNQRLLNPGRLLKLLYIDRMRSKSDKTSITCVFSDIMDSEFQVRPMDTPLFHITRENIYFGEIMYRYCRNRTQLEKDGLCLSDVNTHVLKQDNLLVLRWQYHVLKSLLLCVKFNWMAILVGPTGTGKSSAVKTLANLTGHELLTLSVNPTMDTTEILGGFEQVDYNRHLEEIASKTYRLILITVQECLTISKEQILAAVNLLEKWEAFKKLSANSDNEIRTMSEETELFKTKLKYLQSTVESFPTNKYVTNRNNEYKQILNRIQTLYSHVEREGNLNAGGKFEWIDSTLVKCLRDGTWLLIDNVNLCNPAVLDRLNSVLEPGGSLIMGERGVDENGQLINIKPHPNFRLFLTMDPKNGEISRAMRNRGVEIYLLPPEEEVREEILIKDFQSILHEIGLKNPYVIRVLTKVHLYIHNNIVGEKPNVTQLVHAGFLISQQIARGLDIQNSIETVINDVYLEGKTFPQFELLKDEIKTIVTSQFDNKETITLGNSTLNTLQLQNNPTFTLIQQHTSIFTNSKLIDDEELIQFLLMLYFQKSDLNSLYLREKYIELIFENYLNKLSNINQYYKTISALYNNLKSIQCSHSEVTNFPIDIRWMPESGLNFYLNLTQATYCSNLISFFVYYQTRRNTYAFNGDGDSTQSSQGTSLTIFEFSQKFTTKERLIQNKIVKYIVNIKELFHNIIQKLFQDRLAEITDDTIVSLITGIEWYFRLIRTSNLPIFLSNTKTKKLHHDNLNMLQIYYRFFIKHLIIKIIRIITSEMYDYAPFKDFIQIIKTIESCQITSGSPLIPVRKKFIKHTNRSYVLCKTEPQMIKYRNFITTAMKFDIPNKLHTSLDEMDRVEFNRKLLFLTDETTREFIEKFSKYYYSFLINGMAAQISDFDFDPESVFKYFQNEENQIVSNATKLKIIPVIHHFIQTLLVLTFPVFYEDFDTIKDPEVPHLHQIVEFIETIPAKYNTIPAMLHCQLKTFIKLLEEHNISNTIIQYTITSLQIAFYEFTDNIACRYPNNYIRNTDDMNPMETIHIHCPQLTYLLTNILIDSSINSGKVIKFSSLKNNKQENDNLDYLLKLLENRTCSSYIFKCDNVMNYANAVLHSFTIFLRALTKSLNGDDVEISMTTCSIICGYIENCHDLLNSKDPNGDDIALKSICLFLKKSKRYLKQFWEYREDIERFLHEIKSNPAKDLIPLDLDYFYHKLISVASAIHIGIGYSRAAICCQIPPIDPFIIHELRIKHYKEDQNILEKLCDAHNAHVNISDDCTKFKHELYTKFKNAIDLLKTKTNQFDKAERPKDQKYDDLYQVVNNFLNSQLHEVLSIAKNVYASIWALIEEYTPKKMDRYTESLQASELWLLSVKRFLNQLAQYQLLPDIVYPIQIGIFELQHGLTTMNSLLKTLIVYDEYNFSRSNFNNQLYRLIVFPTFHFYEFDYDTWLNTLNMVMKNQKQAEILQEMLRIVLFCLQDNWNLVCCYQEIPNSNQWDKFYQLFKVLLTVWNKREEEKQILKEAEESLYKTIERKNLTEDDLNEINFKELFPSFYEKDFSDLVTPTTLEQPVDVKETTTPEEFADKIVYKNLLTDRHIDFIYELHTNICQSYTESEWLHQNKNSNKPNFIKSLIQKYKTYLLLQNNVIAALNHRLDKNLLSSLMFLLNVVKSAESCENAEVFTSLDLIRTTKTSFDFYRDEYCGAVKDCMLLINPLKEKITEFLKSWPEHPILTSIKIIVERIENFEITSPVSRFLTGFELLLGKCNEWQQFAPKSLSINDNIEMITRWVIDMRKFELREWKNALNNVLDRVKTNAKRFWFYIYNIIEQFTDYSDANRIKEVIQTLKQFLEKSPIGEFHTRLELIKTFHYHCVLNSTNLKHEKIRNILWNLYHFYDQFSESVANRIKTIRAPIEKEIKDFIKIVKWNDINYWSVKETVEKTHRKLHKFMRKFEESLNESTDKNCLTLSNEDQSNKVTNILRASDGKINPKDYVGDSISKLNQTLRSNEPETEINILQSIQWKTDILINFKKYYTNARKMVKTTITSTKYSNLVEMLNDFIKNIIETSSDLRKLEVDTTLSKPKQKSQAKSILQQKRKALSDLFKNLKTIGLSYQSGLVEFQLTDIEHNYFLAKPIDIDAALQNLQTLNCDKNIKFEWEGCEKYYVRSISYYSHLLITLGNPSAELGVQNLERIRGFSTDLINSIQSQRNVIIDNTRNLYYLRIHVTEMTNIFSNTYFNILKGTQHEINSFYNFFVHINYFAKQLKEFLSISAQNTKDKPVTGTDITSNQTTKLIENITYIEQISLQMIDYFHKLDCQTRNVEYDYEFQQSLTEETLIEISCELDDILEFILPIKSATVRDSNMYPLANVIEEIQREIQAKRKIVDQFISKIRKKKNQKQASTCHYSCSSETPSQEMQRLLLDIEKYVHILLLSIQKLFIKYQNIMKESNDEESGELPENLLKVKLLEELTNDIQIFDIAKLLFSLKRIIYNFKSLSNDWEKCSKIFKTILPLLNQLVMLYQYFVTLQVSTYRASSKLSYVLLKIFCELSVKGFCTPEGLDAEDLEDDSGEGDQNSAGGMGLSEGTGEKDVSDRIESEDQLEDAKREEEYEKQSKEDQKCAEEQGGIEMSEDFEGDLQDVDKDSNQESEQENEDDEKQMGETEPGTEQLDTRLWGDQEDESDDEGDEAEGEQGDGEDADNPDAEGGKDNKGKSEGEKQLGANTNEEEEEGEEEDNTQKPNNDNTQQKEINELNEPEYDDDQVNPYHGKHDPLPEPEDFDLPEDMQLDDSEQKQDNEDESPEDNPFDIDNMKEKMPEVNEQTDETQNQEDENKDSANNEDKEEEDEDDDQIKLQLEMDNLDEEKEPEKEPQTEMSGENQETEDKTKPLDEDKQKPSNDKVSKEENVQASDQQDAQSAQDNIQTSDDHDDTQKRNPDDEINTNENQNEKEGIGQAQREDMNQGHSGKIQKTESNVSSIDEQKPEKRQRPGNTDCDRSLGDTSEPVKKRFKAMDLEKEVTVEDEDRTDEDGPEQKESEHYQHIKESKKHDAQILDAATEEQANQQQIPNENQNDDAKEMENSDVEMSEEVPEVVDEANETEKLETEKVESEKKTNARKNNEGDQLNEDMEMRMEVEGEVIETQGIARGSETTFHTNFENMIEPYTTNDLVSQELEMRQELERKLSDWTETPTDAEAHATWLTYTSLTSSLAHDLCEQLRLILEPTQISRLKGDYRSGRRINMRKIIPYIASQFRKDKIWLRRTRPSKREYQIVIAIDDSQSMADNHSKELAFESLSLLSNALTLLESGQLGVLSFGEKTELLHRLGDQFTDQSGATILQRFKFDQKKTNVAHLVQFTCDMFKQCDLNQKAAIAKLLIIVSDGRGVYSQGEEVVVNAVRRAKHENIFMIFVIIDNPKNKDSILDIQMPIFKDKKLIGMKSYLENFPFSFYIILRDINQLPAVLSDALRQWFELVTSSTE